MSPFTEALHHFICESAAYSKAERDFSVDQSVRDERAQALAQAGDALDRALGECVRAEVRKFSADPVPHSPHERYRGEL